MTVKELIQELEQLDGSLQVVYSTNEDLNEPSPDIIKHPFTTNYWTGKDFISLPKNTPFVML